ncbi:hypothetical protein K1719_026776 [Acacia pycnantha]|nr:hypothetical protein K1719_026776 [Acacia pycnantha]
MMRDVGFFLQVVVWETCFEMPFEDYFQEARHFTTRIMLKPIDDPHVDLIATVSGPLDHKPEENIIGNALFRWQSDVHDPHTFVDLYVSNSDQILQMRSCAYYPRYGFGAYGIFPLLLKKRCTGCNIWIEFLWYTEKVGLPDPDSGKGKRKM